MKLLETTNDLIQTAIVTNNKIGLGNIDKRCTKCAYEYNGVDTINLLQNGYYLILFKADAISTIASQQIQVALVGNGTISNVARSSVFSSEIGNVNTLNLQKIVKVCDIPLSISFINSGTNPATFNNIITSIVKIG